MAEVKHVDGNALIKIELIGSNAESVLANLRGLVGDVTGGFTERSAVINNGSIDAGSLTGKPDSSNNAEGHDDENLADELIATRALLTASEAENASLRNDLKVATSQLKDAQASASKAHKALEQEEKITKDLKAQVADLETQLKAAGTGNVKTADQTVVDTATNDTDADSAISGAETVTTGAATVKAQPGARGQRTTRSVEKPATETPEQKALRETITNDLLDLGGLAEKNQQVATDVEEILTKYKISNGADLTVEQLEDAAADINELIKVYFRE